jgi:hypothetical protein
MRPAGYILDDAMNPVPKDDIIEVAEWCHANPDKLRVGWDEVGPYQVSTVFLHGVDHNWRDVGPPILWETMVFEVDRRGRRSSMDYQWRHTSYAEALGFHGDVVAAIRTHQVAPKKLDRALQDLR